MKINVTDDKAEKHVSYIFDLSSVESTTKCRIKSIAIIWNH